MTRKRNTRSRKPQQSANGAHDTFRRTATDPHHRREASKAIQDQDQVVKEGRSRRRRGGRRSMSPRRGDAQGERQAHRRDDKRSRTPLAAHTIHDDPMMTQAIRRSLVQGGVDQVLAKRRREENYDNKQHDYKKALIEAGEMQPVAGMKPPRGEGTLMEEIDKNGLEKIPDLAAIQDMSEEEKRRFRSTRFRSTLIRPNKATIPDTASETSRHAEPVHSGKDDHKTVLTPPTKARSNVLTPHAPNQKSEASPVRQPGASNELAGLQSRDEAFDNTNVADPKLRQQSTSKIASEIQAGVVDTREPVATANFTAVPSKADMLPTKRNKRRRDEVEDNDMVPAKRTKKPETVKVNCVAMKRRNQKIKQYLNDQRLHVEQNRLPEEGLNFVAYDAYSIPLLCSRSINHGYPFEIVNKPSDKLKRSFDNESEAEVFGRKMLVLRQEALRLSRKRFWTAEDLGRKKASKRESARIIDDCDLYLYDDKVHVATEQGLLPVAVYLKLIGVPDTQPVRFEGHKPTWMGLITTRPERRRVLKTWEPTSSLRDGGCISITSGSIVVAYEHGIFDTDTTTGEESQMAYGARMDDGVAGWFVYANTCRVDWLEDPKEVSRATPAPAIVDWAKFDFSPLAARAAAQRAALPTPAAAAQDTSNNNEYSAFHLPISKASVLSTRDEPVVASPADPAITAANKQELELDAESTQSSILREREAFSPLSVAGGLFLRHDSPNSQSDESASERDNDVIKKTRDSQYSTTITLPRQATDNRPAIAQDTPIVLGTPAFRPNGPQSKLSRQEEDVLDWDDFDL